MSLGPTELFIICGIIVFLLIVPAGVALVIWQVAKRSSQSGGSDQGRRVPCPYCAELILPEAKICRYCGRELETK